MVDDDDDPASSRDGNGEIEPEREKAHDELFVSSSDSSEVEGEVTPTLPGIKPRARKHSPTNIAHSFADEQIMINMLRQAVFLGRMLGEGAQCRLFNKPKLGDL